MERWVGKVAVVTGSSAGIGAQIVVDLANAGMIVVGFARRKERVEALKSQTKGTIHAVQCDVTSEADITSAFKWVTDNLGGVDVLVNNAGVLRVAKLIEPGNTDKIREVLDTNVMGVVLCTREAFQSMKSRNVDGHVIIINSISGHRVSNLPGIPSLNIYPSSKYAVTAMTEVLRMEFQREGTKTKITSISPGGVRTEIAEASGMVQTPELMELFKNVPMLDSVDVSSAVLYVLGTKPHVQVHELIIKPLGELF